MLHMLKTYTDHYRYQEEGATAVEYAILIGIIAILLIAGANVLGPAIRDVFTDIAGQIPAGTG